MSIESIAAAKTVFDLISSAIGGFHRSRREFYDQHIEPVFKLMKEIHLEYTDGFEAVRRLVVESSAPTGDAVEFLKARRRDMEFGRIHAAALATAVSANRRKFGSDFTWVLVEKFCDSCVDYTRSSSSVASFTWYSYYIRSLEHDVRFGAPSGDSWSQPGIAESARSQLLSSIDCTLDEHLPRGFSKISKYHAELRVRLL